MANQRKQTTPDKKPVRVNAAPGETAEQAYARTLIRPSVQAAITLYNLEKLESANTDINALIGEFGKQVDAVHNGNFERIEAMLLIQAHTLDDLFNNLTRRAGKSEYMDHLDRYMRLAFKAQSQCRATLETLAVVNNPTPAMFVRQQNFGVNQQVNNNSGKNSRARKTENVQDKLMEAKQYEQLDTRTPIATSSINP